MVNNAFSIGKFIETWAQPTQQLLLLTYNSITCNRLYGYSAVFWREKEKTKAPQKMNYYTTGLCNDGAFSLSDKLDNVVHCVRVMCITPRLFSHFLISCRGRVNVVRWPKPTVDFMTSVLFCSRGILWKVRSSQGEFRFNVHYTVSCIVAVLWDYVKAILWFLHFSVRGEWTLLQCELNSPLISQLNLPYVGSFRRVFSPL